MDSKYSSNKSGPAFCRGLFLAKRWVIGMLGGPIALI